MGDEVMMDPILRDVLKAIYEAGFNRAAGAVRTEEADLAFEEFMATHGTAEKYPLLHSVKLVRTTV